MSNSYRMKMRAGGPQIRDAGAFNCCSCLVNANVAVGIFLLSIINEQGLFQSSQCLRLLIYLPILSKP